MPKTKTPRTGAYSKKKAYKKLGKLPSLKESVPSPIKNSEQAIYGAGRGMSAKAASAARAAYGNKGVGKAFALPRKMYERIMKGRPESQGVRRSNDRKYNKGK